MNEKFCKNEVFRIYILWRMNDGEFVQCTEDIFEVRGREKERSKKRERSLLLRLIYVHQPACVV